MRRREQGFTLIEIMVVIAIIAGLIGTVVVVVPQMQEKQKRLTCQQNLSQLATMFVDLETTKPGRPPYSGTALLLSWRKTKSIVKGGSEDVLLCPGDNGVRQLATEEDRRSYDDIDLMNPPNDRCSYAVRDFQNYPMPGERKDDEIFACDRQGADGHTMHHTDGLNVAFDNARVRFMERAELNVSPNDPIVVGPDATHPMLKKVVQVAGKKRE